MRLQPGARLGQYEIASPIAAGGMGEVYRARDTRLGREVAIKVLPEELNRDAQRLARFEREARSSSALNHPNIITIHDFTSTDGESWLVMELVRGESLRDVIARGPLPVRKVLAIASGIADGLAAAHAAGLVHRDLKPENVMITSEGTAKILDFGLAKSFAILDATNTPTDVQVSRAGVVLGTATYMSPEQARGEAVDFRTDQFSLGLILYEMATGKNPFKRATPVETMAAILNDEVPRLEGQLGPIVERCLQKSPADRYGSTVDLAHDLKHVSGAPATSPVTTRRKTWWPLIAGAAAVVAAIVIASWRRPSPGLALQAAIPTPEIASVIRDEVALPVALSPNGENLVVYGTDVDGIPVLWLYNLRSGASRQIGENAFSLGFSRDGKSIAYFSGGKLKTVPIDGGPGRIVCDARPEGTPPWSGDTILYVQYSTSPPGIYGVSVSGGKPHIVVGPRSDPPSLPWWPQFLPDGKHFLYLTIEQSRINTPGHQLLLGSIDGSPARKIPLAVDSRVVFASGQLLFVRDGTLLAQAFDPDAGRVTGEAKPIVSGVHYFANTGLAAFAASDNGVLAWRIAKPKSRLAWVDRTGVELRTIARDLLHPLGRISPDGRRYAAAITHPKLGTNDIWFYDLDRDSSERVTFKGHDEAPVWAPDGKTIYFRSDGNAGPPDIFRLNLGEDETSVVYSGPGVQEPHDVSRDGKWMLFLEQGPARAGDIYALPLVPPGRPRAWAATPFNEQSPRFSPDGRWVAYESNVSGRPEVYIRAFEGSELPNRISRDGGAGPRWRGDGKELFFVERGGRVMSAAMNGGASVGAPKMLFQSADIVNLETTDGSRFLIQVEERTADPPVHVLVDWPARVAEKQ
jgi:serine/threonine protein kinase